MSSRGIAEAVFLDTQAFEAASFNFSSASFAALNKYRETGRLRLVLTDITVAECEDESVKRSIVRSRRTGRFVNKRVS